MASAMDAAAAKNPNRNTPFSKTNCGIWEIFAIGLQCQKSAEKFSLSIWPTDVMHLPQLHQTVRELICGADRPFTSQPSDELNIGSGSQGTSLFVEEILDDDDANLCLWRLAELGDLGELQSRRGRCVDMTVKRTFIELVEEPSPERRRARSCDLFLFPEGSVCVDANRASPAPSQAQGSDSVQSESLTVMLRNLPPLLARSHLLAMLDERGFCGRYDFVYLPMDFTQNLGLGYALVGFVDHASARIALESLQGLCFPAVDGSGPCEVSWSEPHRGGLAGHIERYRNSPVMHPSIPDEYKPAIFVDGRRVPFPPPTKKIRPPRIRHRNKASW